jgi:hypothetical protein
MRRYLATLALGLACLILPKSSHASLITVAAALGSATVIDFSQFDIGNFTITSGPTEIGALVGESVTWTGIGFAPGFGGGTYGLDENGGWTDPLGPGGRDGYSFISSFGTSMTYVFNAGPVSGVGGFMNYCPICASGPVMIEALGFGGVVLESYDLEALAPIITPGGVDAGAFRGILRNSSDIFTI